MLDGIQYPQFNYDVGQSMIDLGHGYDPLNHVGDQVVREALGEDYRPGIRIGKPTFTRAAAMTADILEARSDDK